MISNLELYKPITTYVSLHLTSRSFNQQWPLVANLRCDNLTIDSKWGPFNLTVIKCMYSVYNVQFVHESQCHRFLVSYLARLFFDIFPEYNRSVDFPLYCKYEVTVFSYFILSYRFIWSIKSGPTFHRQWQTSNTVLSVGVI